MNSNPAAAGGGTGRADEKLKDVLAGSGTDREDTEPILTAVKIIQFALGICRGIGQHAPCGEENLIGR